MKPVKAGITEFNIKSLPMRERELKLAKDALGLDDGGSLPMRERELKPDGIPRALPMRERELKQQTAAVPNSVRQSLPMRERELKLGQ